MIKRSRSVYVIGSVVIGIVAIILIFVGLVVSGAIDVGAPKLIFSSASKETVYDGQTLTCEEWTLTDGQLKDGHTAKVVMLGKQTSAGTSDNKFDVTILDGNGTDVSADYQIVLDFGTLTVQPRRITISSGSAKKTYDGKPLTCSEYKLEDSLYGLLEGHTLEALVTGEAVECTEKNTISSVRITDADGNDVTANYDVTRAEGDLIIEGGPNEGLPNSGVSADQLLFRVKSDISEHLYLRMQSYGDYAYNTWLTAADYLPADEITQKTSPLYYAGVALEEEYFTAYTLQVQKHEDYEGNLTYMLPYFVSGSASSDASDVLLNIEDANAYETTFYNYKGRSKALQNADYVAAEAAYREYVKTTYTTLPESTLAKMLEIAAANGIKANSPTLVDDIAEFTQNRVAYDIKYYDAEYEGDSAVYFYEQAEGAVCRHYATAATAMYRAFGIPARYTVGFSVETEKDVWVDVNGLCAHAWVELYIDGFGWIPMEVTGGSGSGFGDNGANTENAYTLKLRAPNLYKRIDEVETSGALVPEAEFINGRTTYRVYSDRLDELLAEGYSYEATLEGSQSTIGKSALVITGFTLYDPDGVDVTKSYTITKTSGVLHVYQWEIAIETGGASKAYDGTPLTSGEWTLDDLEGALQANGHSYAVTITGSQTDAGRSANTCEVVITDADGNDVSDYYRVRKTHGTLSVSGIPVKVTAGSAQAYFDPENPDFTLECNEYTIEGIEVDENGKIAGTELTVSVTIQGSQTGVGYSDNVVKEVKITDAEGNDVTQNYVVETASGVLTIYRPQE